MRFAWLITIITLSVSVTINIIRIHNFHLPMVIGELFIIGVLIVFQNDFRRKSDTTSVKKAALFSLGSILLVLINSSIGFLTLKDHYNGLNGFGDSFIQSIQLLFFMDTSAAATTRLGAIYLNMTMTFNWIFVSAALIYVLKSIIYDPIVTKYDKE